jgi:integrase
MTKSYKNARPKKHFVYTVDDLINLYKAHRNTVSNWVNEGLRPSDASRPYVFNGAEVKRFHEARRLTSTTNLRIGEFKCFRCKYSIFPEPFSISSNPCKNGAIGVWATCPNCGCAVNKRVNETNWDKILNCVNNNTALASLDEVNDPVPVGIVNDGLSATEISHCANDRILREWLNFAGRWDSKTVSAKLASIRKFEAFCQGKPFLKITTEDATKFRESLKASAETTGDHQKSISTVRHCASHLKSFFDWLVDQKGFGVLNRSLPSHFDLPKRFEAAGLNTTDRSLPNEDDAVAMVSRMPIGSITARRDRAMVAIAFLAALRADTIMSLRLKHLDVPNRIVIQDAKVSRTKNGKSLRINWFPLPTVFAEIVEEWLSELVGLGFHADDALFPAEQYLQKRMTSSDVGKIPVMTSTYAVTSAFRFASSLIDKKFSPHSAKHYIGALGLKRCRTIEQQAAWSANMGHEGMDVTRRYYQKLPQRDIDDLFEQFHQPTSNDVLHDDLFLMMRYHGHLLVRGTPEFERAEKLVQEHAKNGTFE